MRQRLADWKKLEERPDLISSGAPGCGLVDHLQSELEDSWIKGVRNVSEIARAEAGTDPLARTGSSLTRSSELRVVPGVEALRPELDTAAARFAEDELLEEREIPVLPTRGADGTIFEIAPSACRWRGK